MGLYLWWKRVLITHHKKLQKKLQLGGHADGDTDILRVAIKETIEESGIPSVSFIPKIFDIDVHTIKARGNPNDESYEPEHKHYDIRFIIIVESDSKYKVSEESDKLEWIDSNFDLDGTGKGFKRLFNKWLNLDMLSDDFRDQIDSF